jgi:hypothetical protein
MEDFYGDLARIAPDLTWKLIDGKIRGIKMYGRREHRYTPATYHYQKCRDLGIIDVQYEVSKAEDNHPEHDPEVRKKLLEICGLT